MTTEIRNLLETRLSDIEKESGRLRRALDALGADHARGRRPGPPKPSRRVKGKRAGRGERQRELVETIGKMSGASPSELADAIGVSSTQVHAMARA
jgi:hypothetical protein